MPKQKKPNKINQFDDQLLTLVSTAQESQQMLMTQMSGTGTNPVQVDDCSLFAEALAISLRGFSQYKRVVAKARIQQLMLDI